MSSRKMCVVLLLVLTILWGLSAGNVQAQGQNENKGAAASATVDPVNPPSVSTSTNSTSTTTSGTNAAATAGTSAGTPATAPVPPVLPGKGQSSSPQIRTSGGGYGGVMVGPNGQVIQFGEGGGGSGDWGGAIGSPARADMIRAQEELRRLQTRPAYGGDPFFTGRFPRPPIDPETRALNEQEQKIDQDVQRIVVQYKPAADKETRAKLKKQLEDLTSQQFDVRQQSRELEIKRLETELTRIRESIQKRTENRDQIIKRRVAQLVHEEDDLEF